VGAEDEATFGLIPSVTRGWARRGSAPVTRVNHANKCTNVFATRTKRTIVYSFSKTKKPADFLCHVEKLRRRWTKILLFVDRAPAHRGKKVEAFLAAHRKTFRLEYFPRYTPELNPVEQCWKPGRKKLSNRLLRSLPTMQYHLRKTFETETMPKMFQYFGD
jgi:transposase